MNDARNRRSLLLAALISIVAMFPRNSDATIVEFQTVMGSFEVNLYDNATPDTVANFLAYLNSGAYTNAVYHRSVPGFVVQGGGFAYNGALPLDGIPANPSVANEPVYSNVRGTISMAKLQGQPNSATNQWFFNLVDNSGALDGIEEGFSVFGEVVGNGMDVLDAIALLPTYDFGGATDNLPLQNYTANDFANNVPPDGNHLIIVNMITISDMNVDTAAGLNPPLNNVGGPPPPPPPPPPPSGGGGGGSFGIFGLLALLIGCRFRRPSINHAN